MKKIFSLLLTLALLLSLSACHPSASTQAVTTQPTTWASEAVIGPAGQNLHLGLLDC